MSINLGTAPVTLSVCQQGTKLGEFVVEVPVTGEIDLDGVRLGGEYQPTVASVTVTSMPRPLLSKALSDGVRAFRDAFENTINTKETK